MSKRRNCVNNNCDLCRKLAQSSSVDAQGKDQDVSFAQKNDEVSTASVYGTSILLMYVRTTYYVEERHTK